MNTKKIVFPLMVFVTILLGLSILFWKEVRTPKLGGDFFLTDQNGLWHFRDHAKKLNLLYIGYAKCPDVCPMVLAHASRAFHELSSQELESTSLMFVSVDVEHDTASDVSVYAKQFFPTFIGLSGTQEQVDKVTQQYNASYIVEKDSDSYLGYSIAHADRIYFLDKKGYVLDQIQNPRSSENIVSKIKELL